MQLYEMHSGLCESMVYQRGMIFIHYHTLLIGFVVQGCIHHAVARGFFQHFHSYRGFFMENEYGLGQE